MEIWEKKYLYWINHPKLLDKVKEEILSYSNIEKKDFFGRYLDFGTGGMRGKIGMGTNLMNEFTVKKVTKALAEYLNNGKKMNELKKVVISYDNRRYSKDFAYWAAKVLAKENILVYLSDYMRPTPQLSFLVREWNADAGIMITASHNPKEYNGYKIYDNTGGQITLEVANTLKKILENIDTELDIEYIETTDFSNEPNVIVFSKEVDDLYIQNLKRIIQNPNNLSLNGKNVKILYTPLHGTGRALIEKSFRMFGLENLEIVTDQADGDSDFSTLISPNPEEKSAFELALKKADNRDFDFIFATDPDADRMGIVVFNKSENPVYLTGNQIGILILDFLIRSKNLSNEDLSGYFIAKTIVTSDLGEKIAEKNGVGIRNTLTGFKFIGEQIELAENEGVSKFLFGYEESFGYLVNPFVRDKDAIQAAVIFSEFVLECKEKNVPPLERLDKIYREYGYFYEKLETIIFEGIDGMDKIDKVLNSLRLNPLKKCVNLKVRWQEDYLNSTKTNQLTGEKLKITLPKSNVIKYIFEDGSWICIRPSGTEPKCKIYYSVNDKNREQAKKKMIDLVKIFNKLIA